MKNNFRASVLGSRVLSHANQQGLITEEHVCKRPDRNVRFELREVWATEWFTGINRNEGTR